ncbi:hypothetical protein LTS08_004336 [Lithohypha guttulata]|nr:hypothetical protein LTS08_004336 [Lithohypha guttulata]
MDGRLAVFQNYEHKKTDDKSPAQWRSARSLRRHRRNFLLLALMVLGLAFWHIFHTHSTVVHLAQRRESINSNADAHKRHEGLHHPSSKVPASEKLSKLRDTVKDPIINTDGGNADANVRQRQEPSEEQKGSETTEDHATGPEPDAPTKQKPILDSPRADEDKQSAARRNQQKEDSEEDQNPNWIKGPVRVEADLDTNHEKEPVLSAPDVESKQKVIEAEPDEHLVLEETAENLPEIIHIPFEEAVKSHVLEGWEDDWISHGRFDSDKWTLKEPQIDFVYLWVNGSEEAFQETKHPFELNSILNDAEGNWISSHGVNRYRDWDELRYAVRSVEKYAKSFRNQIQIIVNSVKGTKAGKQVPTWLNDKPWTRDVVKVLAQEEFMDRKAQACLPTFNSLTIENQLFNTPSNTDYMFALSDDMLLGKTHSASDVVSPLLGPVMGFKTNQYNTIHPPNEDDAHRFGEKPFLIYTSWLLNRRFGQRKRKGQGHFGHALSRSIMREAIGSFPGPELQSTCKRFRGEPGFQLYSWFVTFHYLIERYREAMLWSLIMLRSDVDGDGYLSWDERRTLMSALEAGMKNEGKAAFRTRNFYHVRKHLENAGLAAPKVNTDFLWTSLDGPSSFMNLECAEFEVNECLGPGFSISMSGYQGKNPSFSTAVIFERVARNKPQCGDCLLKVVLNQVKQGLSPILPDEKTQAAERELAVKALMRYKYTIVEPNGLFTMLTDAEQIDKMLVEKYVRGKTPVPGQLCLNDDVATEEESELVDIQNAMSEFYQGLFPEKSDFER